MSDFTLSELKRLSEVAPGDEWLADSGPWFGLRFGVRRACDDGKSLLSCNENAPYQDEHVAKLVAYLGTHRDRIVALLEAADALADAVEANEGDRLNDVGTYCERCGWDVDEDGDGHNDEECPLLALQNALAAYEKARVA